MILQRCVLAFIISAISLMKYDFRGDEPMVVLDTLKDWRFEKNVCHSPSIRPSLKGLWFFVQPLTTGSPGIRFYAGAPLRTQDGFNIGTSVTFSWIFFFYLAQNLTE